MGVINTNVNSLITQNALKVNNRAMASAMEQLATGKRINSSKDDAAGLAVSENMTAQIRGLNMAVRNANDGISLAQTAEGAMIEISNMLQRMRELAVQASTGTISNTQRGHLNVEFEHLASQINSTIENSTWNGMPVLSSADLTFDIQVGLNEGQVVTITSAGLQDVDFSAANISSSTAAASALSELDDGLNSVNNSRASLGAVISRLNSAGDNLTNISQNISESRSRILDTDYAKATTELARTQIISQAGTAVLAQANALPQTVLKLLQG